MNEKQGSTPYEAQPAHLHADGARVGALDNAVGEAWGWRQTTTSKTLAAADRELRALGFARLDVVQGGKLEQQAPPPTNRQLNEAVTLRFVSGCVSSRASLNSRASPTRLIGNPASNSCSNTQSTSSATLSFTTIGPRLISPSKPT